MGNAAGLVAERHAERVGSISKKCGYAREVERPGAAPEIVVQELPVFPPDLERMPSTQAVPHVAGNEGGVGASRRKIRGSAEVKGATGNADLR